MRRLAECKVRRLTDQVQCRLQVQDMLTAMVYVVVIVTLSLTLAVAVFLTLVDTVTPTVTWAH